jgi:ComF family protein
LSQGLVPPHGLGPALALPARLLRQGFGLRLASLRSGLRRIVDPLLALAFPSACAGCGRLLSRSGRGPLCETCWGSLPRHRALACRCGLPLLPARVVCGRCRRGRQPLSSGASLGPYEGTLRLVLHQLKYARRRGVARRLASLLLEDPRVAALLAESDTLVPVPLHPRRLRQRGYNQSALLAAALAGLTRRPWRGDLLRRRRDTVPQTGLSAAERRRNVRDAFAAGRRAGVAGKVLTLVDDVLTTGATAEACARVLRAAGAAEVRLLTVARAVAGSGRERDS